ncbi:hypothetical protein BDV93DRAFT_548578 [Ceratobasidium sp. AG-I]|nr:hypothetical protein BDV93DRAFT_548578 [Ceratobasidium sp. AG-I]
MAAPLDTASWKSETLTRALTLRQDCDLLTDLIVLRDKGQESDKIDEHYANERKRQSSGQSQKTWLTWHYNMFKHMDGGKGFLKARRFLDLGCCPGGSSTYVLQNSPKATGIGISLLTNSGGYELAIPKELLSRIDIHMVDLTTYDLAPSFPKPAFPAQQLFPLPFEPASLDLVICDSQWVLNPDNFLRPWNWTRLQISQLLIALRAVSPEGTIFLRLSCVERTITGRILLALCRIANIVRTTKSSQFQGVRSYFYVLVQQVKPGSEEYNKLVQALEQLWYIMTFEGERGFGRDITSDDEDAITSIEELTKCSSITRVTLSPNQTHTNYVDGVAVKASHVITMQSEIAFADGPIDHTYDFISDALQAREDCAALRELNALRRIGWKSDNVDDHFKQQRYLADYVKHEDTDQKWANTMRNSMYHMNKVARFVRATRFLDLGCCPGGYSTFILETCPQATGVGISLPVEDGGHGLAIPAELLPRIDVHLTDLTNYDLAPTIRKPSPSLQPLKPLPFAPGSFDFVVCDGHWLRLNSDNADRPWNWTRLLVSQILLGLRAVSLNGTMFIKFSGIERPMTARLLLALCRISNHVRTIKPLVLHANRGTFYVVAQGVRTLSLEYRKLVAGLEKLWYTMSFEGETGYGRPVIWEEHDYITAWKDVMSPQGLSNIARLGTRIWQIQRDALRKLLQRKGIDTRTEYH